MKRLITVLAVLMTLGVGVRLFHLGPFGIHPGDDILLSQLSLTNGSRFFVVAHRTENLIDAYEVTFYRVDQNGDTFAYYLAHEDSFWWGCTLRPAKDSREIEIGADGAMAARYLPDQDAVMLADKEDPYFGNKTDSYRLRRLLAH